MIQDSLTFKKCTAWCRKLITLVPLEQWQFSVSAQTGSVDRPPIHPEAVGYGAGDAANPLLTFPFLLQDSHALLALR